MSFLKEYVYKLSRTLWLLLKPLSIGVRILMVRDQKVLLVKHVYQDQWFLPGGLVEHGETFEDIQKYTNFIGISNVHKASATAGFGRAFTKAKRAKTIIHGFAVTGKEIRKFDFYSVDSTSWMAGGIYGITYHWTGITLRMYAKPQKERRKRFKRFCEEHGISFRELLMDKHEAVNDFNAKQWQLYAAHIDRRWERTRG